MATNCEQFEQEWFERTFAPAESLRPWSAEFEAHCAQCESCRHRLLAEAHLDRCLDAWKAAPLPSWNSVDLVDRLLESAHTRLLTQNTVPHNNDRQQQRLTRAALVSTCTAVALLIAGLIMTQPFDGRGEPSESMTSVSVTDPSLDSEVIVTELMAGLWHDLRDGSANVAQATLTTTTSMPRSMAALAPGSLTKVPSPAPQEPAPSEAPRESPSAPQLITEDRRSDWLDLGRPLGQSVTSAFRFLGEALPAEVAPAG